MRQAWGVREQGVYVKVHHDERLDVAGAVIHYDC